MCADLKKQIYSYNLYIYIYIYIAEQLFCDCVRCSTLRLDSIFPSLHSGKYYIKCYKQTDFSYITVRYIFTEINDIM